MSDAENIDLAPHSSEIRTLKSWRIVDDKAAHFNIEQTLSAIEDSLLHKNAGLAIGLSRAMVENFCHSIIERAKKKTPAKANLKTLVNLVSEIIKLVPSTLGDLEEVTKTSLLSMLYSFAEQIEKVSKNVGELRNNFCPVSHGKHPAHVGLDMAHAEFIAHSADNICCFIYDLTLIGYGEEPLEEIFNDEEPYAIHLLGELGMIKINGISFHPAEVIWNIEPISYNLMKDEWLLRSKEEE